MLWLLAKERGSRTSEVAQMLQRFITCALWRDCWLLGSQRYLLSYALWRSPCKKPLFCATSLYIVHTAYLLEPKILSMYVKYTTIWFRLYLLLLVIIRNYRYKGLNQQSFFYLVDVVNRDCSLEVDNQTGDLETV